MSAYLLHLRSRVSIRHVEEQFDEFEQLIIPDEHYALSREGRTANYAIVPDRPLGEFHSFLSRHAAKFNIEQVSLVEIGRSWRVTEQGSVEGEFEDGDAPDVLEDESLASSDSCGEWRYARNEDTRATGQIRVRTSLNRWLHKHGRGSKEPQQPATGLLLCFHNPLEENSRFLTHFRGALGKSSRPHLRDEKSVLLTWEGVTPRQLFNQTRYQRYLADPTIHTAFCFTVGLAQKHTAGDLQSVLPPDFKWAPHAQQKQQSKARENSLDTKLIRPASKPQVVATRASPIDHQKLAAAMAKLRAGRRTE